MKKWLVCMICMVSLFGLIGCSGSSAPDWANEEELVAKAQTIIDALNAQDLEEVTTLYDNPEITAETFADSGQLVKEMGDFEKYGEYTIEGGKTDDGQEYARVIQTATYKEGTLIFTVSFFEDGSVAGFYVQQ